MPLQHRHPVDPRHIQVKYDQIGSGPSNCFERFLAICGFTYLEAVELQGDLRDRVRAVLEKKGYVVKG